MTTQKSTWFIITAYDNDILLCEGKLPEFVKAIHGGRETCPTTGKIHFQGAIQCHQQQRFSAIKNWLPKSHIENAKNADAVKQYCMKNETAAGPKTSRTNELKHYRANEMCMLLARVKLDDNEIRYVSSSAKPHASFNARIRKILLTQPELAGQLMNPSLRGFYTETESTWAQLVREADGLGGGANSITPRQTDSSPCATFIETNEEYCDCDKNCWSKNIHLNIIKHEDEMEDPPT